MRPVFNLFPAPSQAKFSRYVPKENDSPPATRSVTFNLVSGGLLRRALNGANTESRLYAADALLYLDQSGRYDMSEAMQNSIRELRSRTDSIQTCGNAGSYKVDLEPINEVLSDSAVAEIPAGYASLAEYGWFRP